MSDGMICPTVGGEPTCVEAACGPKRAAATKRQMTRKRGRMGLPPPVARLMWGIVAYLNAMRQAFLNAGQRLSG
jgi:hypothetical protein